MEVNRYDAGPTADRAPSAPEATLGGDALEQTRVTDRTSALAKLRASRDIAIDSATRALDLPSWSEHDVERLRDVLRLGRGSRATTAALRLATIACSALGAEFAARATFSGPPRPVERVPAEQPRPVPRRPRRRPLNEVPVAASCALHDGAGSIVQSRPPCQKSLAEFETNTARLEEIGLRRMLIRLMDEGAPAAAALRALGQPATRLRWAQRVFKKSRDRHTVLDGRWTRRAKPSVLTPEVQAVVFKYWNGRPRANAMAVWRMVRAELEARRAAGPGETVPSRILSYESVKLYIRSLPKALQLTRGGDFSAWDKNVKMVVTYDPTTHSNEMWQIDHTNVDVWIRAETRPGVWEPARCYLTVVLDVHSRAVMGWVLSRKTPDAWTTALAVRHAVLPKEDASCPLRGLPQTLVPDHGRDFMSHSVASLMRALGIRLDPTPPYYPNMKGEIERFFGTLNSYFSELVGYMEEGRSEGHARKKLPMLLTRSQLCTEVRAFIAAYHRRVHSTTGEMPVERWVRTAHPIVPDAEDLNVLMLKSDRTRRVTKQGIQFSLDGDGGQYLAPELPALLGEEVRLRYNPEDMASILVYSEPAGQLLCEAWLEGTKYSVDDVKEWDRRLKDEIRKRTSSYAKEVEADDRRSARAWDAAQEKARDFRARDAAREPGQDTQDPSIRQGSGSDLDTAPADAVEEQTRTRLERWRQRDRALTAHSELSVDSRLLDKAVVTGPEARIESHHRESQ
jgi:putative transposase